MQADEPAGDAGSAEEGGPTVDGVRLNDAGETDLDLITDIEGGANVGNLKLTYTLSGTAPDFDTSEGADNKLEVAVTYTITNDPTT